MREPWDDGVTLPLSALMFSLSEMLGLWSVWATSVTSWMPPSSHLDRVKPGPEPSRRPGVAQPGRDQGCIELITEVAEKDENPQK